MHMRMVGERRTPGMKHSRHADPGAKMLRIGGNREHRLRRRLEQKAVNFRLVLKGDGADRRRQREHHVVIGQGQKLGFALEKPLACSRPLTLGAMPVPAGVVTDDGVGAVLAARGMPPSSAVRQASMAAIAFSCPRLKCRALALAPGSPVVAENLRNLKRGTRHCCWSLRPADRSASRPAKAGPKGSSPCGSCLSPRACKAPSC